MYWIYFFPVSFDIPNIVMLPVIKVINLGKDEESNCINILCAIWLTGLILNNLDKNSQKTP